MAAVRAGDALALRIAIGGRLLCQGNRVLFGEGVGDGVAAVDAGEGEGTGVSRVGVNSGVAAVDEGPGVPAGVSRPGPDVGVSVGSIPSTSGSNGTYSAFSANGTAGHRETATLPLATATRSRTAKKRPTKSFPRIDDLLDT
jgi:hypothetical protein